MLVWKHIFKSLLAPLCLLKDRLELLLRKMGIDDDSLIVIWEINPLEPPNKSPLSVSCFFVRFMSGFGPVMLSELRYNDSKEEGSPSTRIDSANYRM